VTALGAGDFPAFFKAVHSFDPFPWQVRLAKQVVESGTWPKLLDLPTGAGKTAAIDVAVFHLACEANRGSERRAPLRILFVIDRRIVVDSAAERAKKIRDALQSPEQRAQHPILAEVARRLSSLSGNDVHPLDVVRLRGGAPQERDWARSPAQALVAVSTVDQVGSRLLFRGYGVSPRMWPVHAGLVGADALWLLDEVHLSRPLEQTLKAVEQGHPSGDRNGILAERPRLAPFGLVRLSATPGEKEADSFSLSQEDRVHPGLRPRLDASKLATLHQIDKEPEEALADCVLDLLRPGEKPTSRKRRKKQDEGVTGEPIRQPLRAAVVVNRVDLARRVFERLRKLVKGAAEGDQDKAEVVLLTGRVRPLDRDRIINRLKDLKLFAEPGRVDPPKPIILVATQTIEAGADLDVDALVTEIAPLDCLRQRFGRLDRLGERRESKAAILLHKKSSKEWKAIEKVYGQAARATADWLDAVKDKKGEIDLGIGAFEPILREFAAAASEPKLEDLIARRADAPVLLPVYADLWATTSPAPSATPEPALFLHGPSIATDVQIVWRADIDLDDVAAANVSLDLCPPASLEALSLPVWAAQRWLDAKDSAPLADVAERTPEGDHERGELTCLRYDHNLPEGERWSKADSSAVKPGDRIAVPCRGGGCDEWGWNPRSKDEVVDLGTEANYLQRLKGVLRVTRATLANALHRDGRKGEADAVWNEIRRALPEEGEDSAAAEARALVGVLLDRKVALPLFWRTLIEGRGHQKGIKDRRINIASFGINDWSSGCLLYAEKALDPGLFEGTTEDEPDGGEAITERDDSSCIGEKVLLVLHLQHVEKQAGAYAKGAGLDDHMVELVELAARLHDIGKAEPRFQADLHGQSALLRLGLTELEHDELIAKSARGEGRRGGVRAVPENFRHEALSVALAASHPAITKLDHDDRDLVLWLIGTHHGYGRPFFTPMIDDAADTRVTVPDGIVGSALHAQAGDAPLRLDQGWFERAGRLIRRFGPWELARLEAILRLADHAASAEEQDVSAGLPKAAKQEEAVT
jgi:CRISPR-associated endonuclease/helicase Cas3